MFVLSPHQCCVRVRVGAAYYAGVLDVRVKPGIEMLAPRSFGHPDSAFLEVRTLWDCRLDCLLDK